MKAQRKTVRCTHQLQRYGTRPARPCHRPAHLAIAQQGPRCLGHGIGKPELAHYLHEPGSCGACDRSRKYWGLA